MPTGVFNLVIGRGSVVGKALSSHPDVDMISFTGSTRAGTEVGDAAAHTVKRVSLELGGKSANIVLEDADLVESRPLERPAVFLQHRTVLPRAEQDARA